MAEKLDQAAMGARMKRNSVWFIILLGLFALPGFAKQETPLPQTAAVEVMLHTMNNDMRADYALAASQLAKQVSPLIIFADGTLSFYRGGVLVSQAKPSNSRYVILKDLSHIVLRVYALLALEATHEQERRLALLRQQLTQLEPLLATLPFAGDVRRRQYTIVTASNKLLQTLAVQPELRKKQVADYFNTMRPLLLLNVDAATKEQLALYQTITTPWLKQLTAQEKARLLVVIGGGMMARQLSLELQFFAKVLDTDITDKRLLYLDNQFTLKDELAGLGVYVLDTKTGEDVFTDKWRLHRDIRADAAKKYLRQLKL
jgi:hypothetical protein